MTLNSGDAHLHVNLPAFRPSNSDTFPRDLWCISGSELSSESRMLEALRLVIKQIQWRTTTQWNNILGCQGLWEHIWTDVNTKSCHKEQKSLCFGYCRLVPLNMTIYILLYLGFFLNTFSFWFVPGWDGYLTQNTSTKLTDGHTLHLHKNEHKFYITLKKKNGYRKLKTVLGRKKKESIQDIQTCILCKVGGRQTFYNIDFSVNWQKLCWCY